INSTLIPKLRIVERDLSRLKQLKRQLTETGDLKVAIHPLWSKNYCRNSLFQTDETFLLTYIAMLSF
ncbi:MAG: hypothetical protein AAB277_00695, partial [Planctomycetota bacterium]